MKNGQPVNIPLVVDLHIEAFAGGTVTRCESCSTNIVYDQYADGRWYATQRPGLNVSEDASGTVSDARGRGGYYWDAVTEKYLVNNDTVYKSSYAGSTMTISEGTTRVFMGEVGTNLVILDQENDEGWYITTGASTTINQIAAAGFTGLTLVRGGAIINDKLYVGSTDGIIAECDVSDPTTWNTLNQATAELSPDKLVAIAEHIQHVVAFGTRTIEFFSQNQNATGSTLTARLDISYAIGIVNQDAFWQIGDVLYFVGQESGSLGVYAINAFSLQKLSGEDMDKFLTTAVNVENAGITLCGTEIGGRHFLTLTTHYTTTDISPQQTLIYSAFRPFWGFWDTNLSEFDYFPLVAWMKDTTTRNGEGILINGDTVTIYDSNTPVDTVAASGVYEAGVFEVGVYLETPGSGTDISFEVITGQIDLGTTLRKRSGDLWIVATPLETSDTITVYTSDDDELKDNTWTSRGTLDVSEIDDRLNRLGPYRRRNHKIAGTLSEQYRMEKIQTSARVG